MKQQIRIFDYRIWLPITVLCCFLLLSLLMAVFKYFEMEGEVINQSESQLNHDMYVLQREVEAHLTRNEPDGVLRELTSRGMVPEYQHLSVIDDFGVVHSSTDFAWINQSALDVIPKYDPHLAMLARDKHQGQIMFENITDTIKAAYPIRMVSDTDPLHSAGLGVIYVELSLINKLKSIWGKLIEGIIATWLATLLVVIVISIIFPRMDTMSFQFYAPSNC